MLVDDEEIESIVDYYPDQFDNIIPVGIFRGHSYIDVIRHIRGDIKLILADDNEHI